MREASRGKQQERDRGEELLPSARFVCQHSLQRVFEFCFLELRAYCPDGSFNPRSLSIGSILGSLPNQALYMAARSIVLPRESTMRRNRSPFARVRPPLSTKPHKRTSPN